MQYDPIVDLRIALHISLKVFEDAAVNLYRSIMATVALEDEGQTYYACQKFTVGSTYEAPKPEYVGILLENAVVISEEYMEAQITAMTELINGLKYYINNPGDATEYDRIRAKDEISAAGRAIDEYRENMDFARRIWTRENPDMGKPSS